jgi:HEAT repeat protein
VSYYTESAEFYYQLIVDSAPHLKDKRRAATDADREMASTAYNRMVEATWGLIACGAGSTPYAIALARSKDRDHREMAANVFCGLRDPERAPQIIEEIRKLLSTENDRLVIDSLLGALGPLRSREAIPDLAKFILDESEDGDTRDTAATSLGQIVRKRFDKSEGSTVEKAKQWLIVNGYEVD